MGKRKLKFDGTRIEADNVNIIRPAKSSNHTAVHKTRRQPVGVLVSEKSSSFLRNIKANANKNLLKTLAFGAAGAVLYPLVPTVLQATTKTDWNGYKGLVVGVGTAALLGLATGKSAITVGACSAAGTHLLYSKGTGTIERMTGTAIFRMHPENVIRKDELDNAIAGVGLSDGIPMQKCTSCGN
jgi:hypothetical protein